MRDNPIQELCRLCQSKEPRKTRQSRVSVLVCNVTKPLIERNPKIKTKEMRARHVRLGLVRLLFYALSATKAI